MPMPMKSKWFRKTPGGPQRAVTSYFGNYSGETHSFKGGTVKTIQWESWSHEIVLSWVLERDRECLRYVDQAEKYLRMYIDYLSFWKNGRQVLHYVKPASQLFTKRNLHQVELWSEYARCTKRDLQIVVERGLTPTERIQLPSACEVFVLPTGVARDNLEFLAYFSNPRICPESFRLLARSQSRAMGQAPLRNIGAECRTESFEPIHALYYLVFAGSLRADESSKLITPESVVWWEDSEMEQTLGVGPVYATSTTPIALQSTRGR